MTESTSPVVGDSGGVGDGQASGEVSTPEPRHTDHDMDKQKGAARGEERKAWLNALGVSSREEALRLIETQREVEEAAKTETEREREARLAVEQERDKFRTLADTRLVDSELRIALLNAGVPSDRIAAAAKLVERDGIAVNGNAVEGLDDAVTQTVEGMPWLLGETQQQTFRAADTTPQPTANATDPDQKMGSWINQILNQP